MRVFCLDWDSPDPDALREGVAKGWLPNLSELLRRGAVSMIEDTQEILTPASWPTLNRGTVPARHGQIADRELLPGTYRQAPVAPERADDPPFWRYVGDAGLRCTIASIYNSPLLKDLPGTQVVGWGTHDPYTSKERAPRSSPPGMIRELERIVGGRTLRYGLKVPRTTSEACAYLSRTLRGIEQQGAALEHLVDRTEWDFFFGGIADGHEAGHVLWSHHDPAHPLHDRGAPERLRTGLKDIYAATDRQLGRLLHRLRPEDTVLVVTPYGMGPNHYMEPVGGTVLEAAGQLRRFPDGRPAPADTALRTLSTARRAVHRIVPPGLRPALARLVPRERLIESLAFAGVDWSETRAFALWGDGATLLRVNLQGREPTGIVNPRAYEGIREELIRLFEGLRDADTGERLVTRVDRFEQVGGGPVRGGMPDICVQWRRDPRPRAIRSPQFGEQQLGEMTGWASRHWTNGFLIGAGPSVPSTADGRLEGPPIRLVDFAPTVLALLGVAADHLDGSPVWPLPPARRSVSPKLEAGRAAGFATTPRPARRSRP